MTAHRRPPMPGPQPRGSCQWCAEPIIHPADHKLAGQADTRRSWHPACVTAYRIAAFSSDQRSHLWRRDSGVCAECGSTPATRRWMWRGGQAVSFWDAKLRRFFPGTEVSYCDPGWDADHIKPLWSAPRDLSLADREQWFGLANLQTLCVPCHKDKSAREAAERAGKPKLPLHCDGAA